VDFYRLENDPNILLRLFLTQGLLSFILILCFSGIGIYRVTSDDVLQIAVNDARRIANVLITQQKNFLFAQGETAIALLPQDRDIFDRLVKDFLHPFGIVKVKVFDPAKQIIYSTDRNIIGRTDGSNERLKRALSGEIDFHQESKETVVDLVDEKRFDVDVVETYLPVFNAIGAVAGSMELYLDVTHYRDEIFHRVTSSILILAAILLVVFALSYIVVILGTRQLKGVLERLHLMAMTDSLTGILNRGAVIIRAEEELSRLSRQPLRAANKGLGLIMIDLDYFKEVNDNYGHQAGDEVLRETVWRVRHCLRDYDLFGRFGGEEFLVVTPDSSEESAEMLAERIRREVISAPFRIGKDQLSITASFGVTCCCNPEEGLNAVLQRADQALYLAKERGRNRVAGVV